MKRKIIAVFKTHFDFGYTDLAEKVLEQYCTKMLSDALDVCRATEPDGEALRYKWTLPSYLLMQMAQRCPAEQKNEFLHFVENGQICCHALPFTMHTELLDQRLLDNMFLFTDDYVRTFGKPFPISAKMTDVPGHSSAIIAPLVRRGVKFLHLGKNAASIAPKVPPLFWWEDKQGNRLLTMYNQNYGSGLFPPAGWKFPVWLALCHTYDNAGVQGADFVSELKKEVGSRYDFATGTLDDFARELLKCDLSGIPVVRGELGDTWIHGVGSLPRAVSDFRRSRSRFYALEDAAAQQGANIGAEKREFYENALVFTEHTFGANVLRYLGTSRAFDREGFLKERRERPAYEILEESWREQHRRAETLREICARTEKKVSLPPQAPRAEKEFTLSARGSVLEAQFGGRRVELALEYRVFGAQDVHTFVKKYVTRFFDWSISDFGRMYYPEIPGKLFRFRPQAPQKQGSAWRVHWSVSPQSVRDYGNFAETDMEISYDGRRLRVRLCGRGKQATPLVEGANFIVRVPDASEEYIVDRCGGEIDVDRDMAENANQILWSMNDYARIGNMKLYSVDAPLVSFGRNAVCRYNAGRPRKKKPAFVVNLFNNHWGTNFPQWIEGDLSYEFFLEPSEER